MNEGEKDNAVLFLDWMCSEGVSFFDTCKQLGQFGAMLLFLRYFDKWLCDRAAEISESAPKLTTTSQGQNLKSQTSAIG